MTVPLMHVDAFTDGAFTGNPAAVCLLDDPRDAAWMQKVASELNLAETAFLQQAGDGFNLRWFTPTVEVDLCGHATLASAHVLWETGLLAPASVARFSTRSGVLTATRRDEWIELDFPVTPDDPVDPPPPALAALGSAFGYVGRSAFDYLVEVESEQAVRALTPDLRGLQALTARGVIVTARSATPGVDFVSRFFAPASGIDEDPVTGSAHCCLAPFWRRRLGKNAFVARQLSPRGGLLRVTLTGDRVRLAGRAITVTRGELLV